MFRLILLILSLLPSSPAMAQYSDNARVEQLEKRLITLERAYYRDGTVTSSAPAAASDYDMPPEENASLQLRLQQLEEKIAALQGKIEELEFQLNRQPAQAAVPQITEVAPPRPQEAADWHPNVTDTQTLNPYPAQASAMLSNPVQESYDRAFTYLQRKQYVDAAREFEEFIENYPSHALTSNAYYWLGEAYYAQREYNKAAIEFMQGYKDFPAGAKAPDSLLKLAMALGNQGKPEDACVTLAQLQKSFPDISIALRQRAEQEKQNYKCP